MNTAELIERFQFFDDPQDRYAYLISLGKKLPSMDEADKNPVTLVKGCMSQVWLVLSPTVGVEGAWDVIADSDAFIVRGLIFVVQTAYNKKTPEQMRETDIESVFKQIGLDQHLTANRRNGFFSMVERIRQGPPSA